MSPETPDDNPSAPDINNRDDVVRIYASHDADGVPSAQAVLTPHSDTRRKEVHCDPRPIIPVIFLPGVMGSVLLNKTNGASLWSAPNIDAVGSAIAGVASIIGDYFQSASTREIRLDPTVAVVDPDGPIKVGDSGLSEEEARRRGWGTVHRWSYQPTLAWLQTTLNTPMQYGQLTGLWAKGDPDGKYAPRDPIIGTDPATYGVHGATKPEPLTKESAAFQSFIGYHYRVYAIGYNFLQSNELSAQQVLDGVDLTLKIGKKTVHKHVMGIREICRENRTGKAILITHSMGGLVARMASQFCGGENDILGVIHGAQPATGAPLFAKRFRTGGEDFIGKSLLGRDDAEFVAIAANAEGPMELAPMPDYNDKQPWWIFTDNQGNACMSLPHNDALSELYTNDAWYGLLPDKALLDPAGIVKKRLEDQGSDASVYDNYVKTMGNVVDRQTRLINNYHPNTYALYGDGTLPTPTPTDLKAAKLETWGKVIWRGDLPEGTTEADLKAARFIDIKHGDNHHGVLTLIVRGQTVKFTVQQHAVAATTGQPDNGIVPGDGTAPGLSAQAQGRGLLPGISTALGKADGVQLVFRQGGYEHQFCFSHPWTRWGVLYSMAQLVHRTKGQTP